MSEVNFDKLVEVSDELIEYDGVLPLLIRALIIKDWSKHLIEQGTYNEVIQECVDTKPHTYDEAVKELTEWCKQNQDYKDLIK